MKAEDNYLPWVDEVYLQSTKKRIEGVEELLSKVAGLDDEAEKTVKAFANPKEFEKLSYLGFMNVVDMGAPTPGKVQVVKFPAPVVAMKHTKLPLIYGITTKLPSKGSLVDIEKSKAPMGVNQLLDYSQTLSRMSVADKKKLYELTIDGIRTYRKDNSKGDVWLSDFLESNKDFEFHGFTLNLPYINVDPKFGDTKSFWIHPWGTPQLLFTHRRLPIIMVVGPSVRLDQNVLGDRNMTGYTG
jgi:hypothetical protein